jgi:hypothetical protein
MQMVGHHYRSIKPHSIGLIEPLESVKDNVGSLRANESGHALMHRRSDEIYLILDRDAAFSKTI